ncbi:hypothetical protein EQV77_10565 [Halobacillus fulvus]|nr:hypothetical protein EQV77_10565 [Halobacillus fulvus]
MKKVWKSLIHKEEGNVLVFFALSLVILCGMVALVVDGGVLFFEKSRLQKSLDAAALAGAQELLVSQSLAETEAISYAGKNGYPIASGNVDTGADFVEVTESVNKSLTFARVLGINDADVPASARAEISGTLIRREGVVPVGLEVGAFSRESVFTIHFQPGNGNGNNNGNNGNGNGNGNNGNGNEETNESGPISGNFGFLDIEDPDYNTLRDKIKYGVTMEISNEMETDTEPGLKWGQVKQGFEDRILTDAADPDCSSYETADDSCARVVVLPLVESFAEVNGKSQVRVQGFAAFWIESVDQHSVNGRFVDIITYGEFSEEEDENEFGVYGVRLVQ